MSLALLSRFKFLIIVLSYGLFFLLVRNEGKVEVVYIVVIIYSNVDSCIIYKISISYNIAMFYLNL